MMRGLFAELTRSVSVLTLLAAAGCGGTVRATADEPAAPQEPYGTIVPSPPPTQSTQDNRLTPHDGRIVPSARIRLVYVGDAGYDQAPREDDFVQWLVTSDYWQTLAQYGVSSATLLPTAFIARDALAPPSLVTAGLIEIQDLDAQVRVVVNGSASEPPSDGVAGADAYVFFLPDGLNVSLGHRGGYESKTCTDEGAYHAHDGVEPYTIVAPCDKGRGTFGVSHEITEMVTDPIPAAGWLSDGDVSKSGGEIADLCNVPVLVEAREVTQLWSNSDGQCVPFKQ